MISKFFDKIRKNKSKSKRLLVKDNVLHLCLFLIIALIYVPYVIKGGFIIDDWGVVYQAKKYSSFWQNYLSWFPLFSNRPLAPFILAIVSTVFNDWSPGYIMTNLFFWLSSVIITARIFEKYTSKVFFVFFVFFASIPVIASTLIFSTAMQLVSAFSFLLWSISLLLLCRYLISKKKILYILSYAVLLMSFLIYEITLPLLAITALFPLYIEYFYGKLVIRNPVRLILRYFSPIAIILIIVLLYQKLIMPRFMIVYSRLDFKFSWDFILSHITSWCSAVFFDFPILLVSSLTYKNYYFLRRIDVWIILVLISITCIYLKKKSTVTVNNYRPVKADIYLFYILLLSFISGALLYILTNTVPTISGYGNRGLSVSWFTLSLIFAFISYKFIKSKIFYVLIGVLALVIVTFIMERDNYIESYRSQLLIVDKIISKFNNSENLTSLSEKKSNVIVIGNVPLYTVDNFNNEEIFDHCWDFGFALNLKSYGKIDGGDVLTQPKVLDGFASISENNINMRDGLSANISDVWYYEFDQHINKDSIEKINNYNELARKMEYIKDNDLHTTPQSYFYKTKKYIQSMPYIGEIIK